MDGPLAVERKTAGITQSELAREIGVSQKSISQTERRERLGLGVRADTHARYLAAIEAIGKSRRAVVAEAGRVLIAEGEQLLAAAGL